MSNGIDPNAVASAAVAELVARTCKSVLDAAGSKIKRKWSTITEDFSPYLLDCHKRNASVRLISQRDRDVDLAAIYVSSRMKSGDEIVSDDDMIYRLRENMNAVIIGDGGAGKTFFMRYLWMSLFESAGSKVPIFIELRQLNQEHSEDLKAFIWKCIARNRHFDEEVFLHFCNNGLFCFVLDGFDEINHRKKDPVQRQILDMASLFPECRFAVSSRHDQRFSGWQGFSVFESCPFDFAQTRELVEKIPFDPDKKNIFKVRLTESFYRSNMSFLSNPLLTILMMMTFDDNMNIPSQMTIFYDHVFTTLYQRHDATKTFDRKKYLNILDFQRSFGVFCLLSYVREKFEFSTSEILQFIENSREVCGIDASCDDILTDYRESVNLLRLEGFTYVFIHRSFQEYFCAYAIIHKFRERFRDIVNMIQRRYGDNVIQMLFEMDSEIVLSEYIEPLLSGLERSGKIYGIGNGRFKALTASDFTLQIIMGYDRDEDNRHWLGLGYTLDDGISSLLNNASKIMRRRSSQYIDHELFDVLRLDEFELSLEESILINVTFKSDRFELVSASEGNIDEQTKRAISELSSRLEARTEILDKLEAAVHGEIKAVVTWCRRELAKKKVQGRALDRLLGF